MKPRAHRLSLGGAQIPDLASACEVTMARGQSRRPANRRGSLPIDPPSSKDRLPATPRLDLSPHDVAAHRSLGGCGATSRERPKSLRKHVALAATVAGIASAVGTNWQAIVATITLLHMTPAVDAAHTEPTVTARNHAPIDSGPLQSHHPALFSAEAQSRSSSPPSHRPEVSLAAPTAGLNGKLRNISGYVSYAAASALVSPEIHGAKGHFEDPTQYAPGMIVYPNLQR